MQMHLTHFILNYTYQVGKKNIFSQINFIPVEYHNIIYSTLECSLYCEVVVFLHEF